MPKRGAKYAVRVPVALAVELLGSEQRVFKGQLPSTKTDWTQHGVPSHVVTKALVAHWREQSREEAPALEAAIRTLRSLYGTPAWPVLMAFLATLTRSRRPRRAS
jgi:hypothetical protein